MYLEVLPCIFTRYYLGIKTGSHDIGFTEYGSRTLLKRCHRGCRVLVLYTYPAILGYFESRCLLVTTALPIPFWVNNTRLPVTTFRCQ